MSRVSEKTQARAAWTLLAPALILLGVFFVVPVLFGLFLSFTDYDIYAIGSLDTARFVGVRNYSEILKNPLFWTALRNTFYYVLAGAPLSAAVSLFAALLVNQRLGRWRGVFRTAFFMPVVTTLVAVAIVWRYLYQPRYGLFNSTLGALGFGGIDWLGNPKWSMPAIIFLAVWKNFGYNMLIFIAGLQSISRELYEAAEVDGASAWQRFVTITLPGLAPTFLFVGIMTMIGHFQIFSEPYVMTQGGPLKSTTSIVLLMYEEGFRWWRMGMASAIAFILFVIMLVATFVQMRVQKVRA